MRSFLRLKGFLYEHKWSYMIGIVWLILVDGVQLLVPQIFRSLTDDFQAGTINQAGILRYILFIILTGLLIALGRFFWRVYIFGNSRKLEYYLRKKIFTQYLSLSPNYFNTHKTGDLMAHATNDVNAVRMAMGQGIMMIVDSTFMMVLSLIMMARTTNLRLTAIVLATLPFTTVFVIFFGRMIHKRFKKVQEAFSNLTDTSQENFSGIRVIKSFVQEDLSKEEFRNINEDNFEKNLDLVKISGLFRPFIQFISAISFLLVIFFGSKEVILNRISLGEFIAFNSYLGLLIWPMAALGFVINIFQRGAASMERINIILDEESEIVEVENPIELKSPKGRVEFENVSFKYPNTNQYALKNISFILEDGKSLAILGKTGSGKSTIVNLLLRLYDIEEGKIKFSNVDIKKLSFKSLRENIGYVPQDNFLFSTTIEENIGFAFDEELEEERIIEAAKIGAIYENILDFPDGFDTVLGERGVTLSGGQKQRTSIARALIKDPALLILDDSLSSVDTKTEERILSNLGEYTKDSSSIIISHRVSTVKDSDEIIFLEDGSIAERGSHDELLALRGLYYELNEKQLLEEKLTSY